MRRRVFDTLLGTGDYPGQLYSDMRARISLREIPVYAARYEYPGKEGGLNARKKAIKTRGCLALVDLCAVCDWKAPRAAGHARKNTDAEVREISRLALSSAEERVRIEVLQVLHGVNYPTASVILHFFHPDPYPIIDYRALWTLGFEQPSQYTFDFWWRYLESCRSLFRRVLRDVPNLTMRELDRALWQYSKENQRAD
jgi:hypothetical protein